MANTFEAGASSEDDVPLQPLLAHIDRNSEIVHGENGSHFGPLHLDGGSQVIDMDLLDFNMQDEFGFLSALGGLDVGLNGFV